MFPTHIEKCLGREYRVVMLAGPLFPHQVPPTRIVALCRNTKSPRALDLTRKGVRVIQLDCSDEAAVNACDDLAELEDVAGVFHLAGVSCTPTSHQSMSVVLL